MGEEHLKEPRHGLTAKQWNLEEFVNAGGIHETFGVSNGKYLSTLYFHH
jgi:hypothetical protein